MIPVGVRTILVGVTALCFLSGCGLIGPPLHTTPEARAVITDMDARNSGIQTFKGIGAIRWEEKGQGRTARLAWIGSLPDKIRMGVLTVAGTPAMTFSADGEYYYALNHQEARLYKTAGVNPGFKQAIGIPVYARDVAFLLSGKIPLVSFSAAALDHTETGRRMLILSDRWGNIRQRIYFMKDTREPGGYDLTDTDGRLLYSVALSRSNDIAGYQIPFDIRITAPDAGVHLQMERCWANPSIPADAFIIQDPER